MGFDDDHDMPREYDLDAPPSITIVQAIADLEDVDPRELNLTLYDHIDPNALDTLCESNDVYITLTIDQYRIYIGVGNIIKIESRM